MKINKCNEKQQRDTNSINLKHYVKLKTMTQEKMLSDTKDFIKSGKNGISILDVPTGSGKTFVMSFTMCEELIYKRINTNFLQQKAFKKFHFISSDRKKTTAPMSEISSIIKQFEEKSGAKINFSNTSILIMASEDDCVFSLIDTTDYKNDINLITPAVLTNEGAYELNRLITNEKERSFTTSNIINNYIKSSDSKKYNSKDLEENIKFFSEILKNRSKVTEKIKKDGKKEGLKELNSIKDAYRKNKNNENMLDSNLYGSFIVFKKFFSKLLKDVVKEIDEDQDLASKERDERKKRLINELAQDEWIKLLFPGIFYEEAEVVLMTMDKTFFPINPIYKRSFYIKDILCDVSDRTGLLPKKASVFIFDEIDACYKRKHEKLIEEAISHSLDLISLLSVITGSNILDTDSFSGCFTDCGKESFKNYKNDVKEFFNKYPRLCASAIMLNSNIKENLEDCESDSSGFKGALFANISGSVYSSSMINSDNLIIRYSDNNSAWVIEQGNNILSETEKQEGVNQQNKQLLKKLVEDMEEIVNHFIRTAAIAVYSRLKKAREKTKNNIEINTIITPSSIIDSFLNQNVVGCSINDDPRFLFLKTKILDRLSLVRHKKISIDEEEWLNSEEKFVNNFYNNGISMTTVENKQLDLIGEKYLTSGITSYSKASSPEADMLSFISGSQVIAMSATAKLSSANSNYDWSYLKNNMKGCGVFRFFTDSEENKKILKSCQENEFENYKNGMLKVEKYIVRKTKDADDYNEIREGKLLKAAESAIKFGCIFMLAVFSKGSDTKENGFLNANSKNYIIKELKKRTGKNCAILEIGSQNFEDDCNKIIDSMREHDFIIAKTTYQTASAGMNLKIPADIYYEKGIKLFKSNNKNTDSENTDPKNNNFAEIESIYIDKPSFMTSLDKNRAFCAQYSNSDDSYIKRLNEIAKYLSMEIEDNKIDINAKNKENQNHIKDCISKTIQDKKMGKIANEISLIEIIRTIMQSTGRMHRGWRKTKTQYIFIDEQIEAKLNNVINDDTILGLIDLSIQSPITRELFSNANELINDEDINAKALEKVELQKTIEQLIKKNKDACQYGVSRYIGKNGILNKKIRKPAEGVRLGELNAEEMEKINSSISEYEFINYLVLNTAIIDEIAKNNNIAKKFKEKCIIDNNLDRPYYAKLQRSPIDGGKKDLENIISIDQERDIEENDGSIYITKISEDVGHLKKMQNVDNQYNNNVKVSDFFKNCNPFLLPPGLIERKLKPVIAEKATELFFSYFGSKHSRNFDITHLPPEIYEFFDFEFLNSEYSGIYIDSKNFSDKTVKECKDVAKEILSKVNTIEAKGFPVYIVIYIKLYTEEENYVYKDVYVWKEKIKTNKGNEITVIEVPRIICPKQNNNTDVVKYEFDEQIFEDLKDIIEQRIGSL